MEKEKLPIQDIGTAEECAYAEKPYRDALVKYEESLTPEQKQALDWIASKEGEAAIQAYEEKKGEEDPRITQLRENALKLLEINNEVLRDYLRNYSDKTPKDLEDKFEDVQRVFSGIGMTRIENKLSKEDISLKERVKMVDEELANLHSGVEGGAWDREHGTFFSNTSESQMAGDISRQIGFDNPSALVPAIEQLALAKGSDNVTVAEEYLPYINDIRKKTNNPKDWDKVMQEIDYLWVEKKGEYMSLDKEKKE